MTVINRHPRPSQNGPAVVVSATTTVRQARARPPRVPLRVPPLRSSAPQSCMEAATRA